MSSPLVLLDCGFQAYDWGKIGQTSKVAQFLDGSSSFTLDEKEKYAELWMGTHPSLPSKLAGSSITLSEYLSQNPQYLGLDTKSKDLPFLFKVLSIGKALSVQAHPDKKLGKKLFAERPKIYKDPNHKPEMAISLTPFTAFCGFRPLPEIANYVSTFPEFSAVLGSSASKFTSFVSSSLSTASESEKKEALKDLFSKLMNADEEDVKKNLSALVERMKKERKDYKPETDPKDIEELILRLEYEFPGDIGIFCVFVLNWVTLEKAGMAIFLKANEPHAYLSGDIMECMATSDNVIRVGLTPKLRDIPTLLSMLTYNSLPPAQQILQPLPFKKSLSSPSHSKLFDPPIDEFSVACVELSSGEKEVHAPVDGPSILINSSSWEGAKLVAKDKEGKVVEKFEFGRVGQVLFLGAGYQLEIEAAKDGLTVFRAFVEGFEEKDE